MDNIKKYDDFINEIINASYTQEWPMNKQEIGVNADDVANDPQYAKSENMFQQVQDHMKIILKPILMKKNKNVDDTDVEKVSNSFFSLGDNKNQEIRKMVDNCKDPKQTAQDIVNKYIKYVKINFNTKDNVNDVEQDSVMSSEGMKNAYGDVCPECDGKGYTDKGKCKICKGSGLLPTKRKKAMKAAKLENLKIYDDFISVLNSKNIKSDRNTTLFLEGKITEEQWKEQLFNSLNENWLQDVKTWFVDKILSTLKSTYEAIMNKIAIGYLKVKSIVDSVINWIKKIKDKHPVIWWIIVTIIVISIIIFFLILTSQQAKAGEPPDKAVLQWNYAIGLIDGLQNYKPEDMTFDKLDVLMHAKAYCMDMRDGVLGNQGVDWSSENIDKIQKLVDIAIKSFNDTKQTALSGDKSSQTFIMDMIEKGSEFINFMHQKTVGMDRIVFSVK